MRILLVPLACLLTVHPARAGETGSLFESYSPVTRAFYGPIAAGRAPRVPSWYRVIETKDEVRVIVEPEGRIRWRSRYEKGRLLSKEFFVRDRKHGRCGYKYDESGRRIAKIVTFKGEHGHTVKRMSIYEYDRQGRLARISPFRNTPGRTWRIAYTGAGRCVWTLIGQDGRVLRRDSYDAQGRLRESAFGASRESEGKASIVLQYRLDKRGRVRKVLRRLGRRKRPPVRLDRPTREKYLAADPPSADGFGDDVDAVGWLNDSMSRREVHLAVGIPPRGVFRLRHGIEYVEEMYGCRLNRPTSVVYDPLDRVARTQAECICGYCFPAEAKVDLGARGEASIAGAFPGSPVRVFDPQKKTWTESSVKELHWHWVSGGVRINDDAIQASPKHELLTPAGTGIQAADLKKGSRVLGADGRPIEIRNVSHEKLIRAQKWYALVPEGSSPWHAVNGFVVGPEQR